jgi:hypothetical protein
VRVLPGTYGPEVPGEAFLVFRRRHNGVTLEGAGARPGEVVLDGAGRVLHVVFFDEGIDRTTVMSGFTITGGRARPEEVLPEGYRHVLRPRIRPTDDFHFDGAGIMVYNSTPVITNNVVTRNVAGRCGGGISVFSPQTRSIFSAKRWKKLFTTGPGPLIVGNVISRNRAHATGAGLDVYNWAKAVVVNNVFEGNASARAGGAIAVLDRATAEIDGNTIVGNSAEGYGSAVAVYEDARPIEITNTIFVGNRLSNVIVSHGGKVTVRSSCFFDNDGDYRPATTLGNLWGDPLFVKGPRGPYYLTQEPEGRPVESPCVDAGVRTHHNALIHGLTTRTDGAPDTASTDIGFHYAP